MKKRNILNFLLIVFIIQTSCRSSKELTMFSDLKNDITLREIPGKAPEYRIKPFDNLYLSVLTLDSEVNQLFNPGLGVGGGYGSGTQQMFGDRTSQYINGYLVDKNGDITLPIIGKVKVAGLNLAEAQTLIKENAEGYLKNPNVNVKVLNFKVNISGEVRNPGLYYNYEGSLNIVDAISMANGITEFANLSNVLVIRHNESDTKTYNVNLQDKSVYYSDVFFLQPNDIVYIQPGKYKRTRENSTIYSLILSTISTLLVATTILLR
jgi:polysaccharide biosynthesis/export protein